jgi:hypothetical protein
MPSVTVDIPTSLKAKLDKKSVRMGADHAPELHLIAFELHGFDW